MVNPIPDDYPRVTPYLTSTAPPRRSTSTRRSSAPTERMRMGGPDGKIGHAELELGNSVIMLADEHPEIGRTRSEDRRRHAGDACTSTSRTSTPSSTRAIEAGASELRAAEGPVLRRPLGQFEDPFGHHWNVATHVEDVSPEEMSKRAAEAAATG